MRKFKLMALLLVSMLSINVWGEDKTITLTYSNFDLTTSSYAKKTATVGGVSFTIDKGYKDSNNSIQMNSSQGSGTLYNTTAIKGLKSIKVNVSSGTKTYTVYTGTSSQPTTSAGTGSSTSTINVKNSGDTYFKLSVSGASYFSSIVITYDDDDDPCEDVGTVKAGTYEITPNNAFWGTSYSGTVSSVTANSFTQGGAQDGICIIWKNGSSTNAYINDLQSRVYQYHNMKFSVPEGYLITAIAFTADGSSWGGTHTASVGTMSDNKHWAGSAKEVTITFGNATCRMTGISVTYKSSSDPSCSDLNAPSSLSASDITMSGATLSWTGDDNASSYTVMVGDKAYENVTSSSLTVSDLQPETKYSWSVKAIGDGTTYCSSNATNGTPFTTLADPSKKTITYNFNDANAYPSGFPTGGTNVANAEEFTISGNKIIINAPKSYYEINSTQDASRALFFGQSSTTLASTAYLEFPAFKNYKLTKVVATTGSGVAGSVSINIYNTSWTAVSTAQSTVSSTKKEFTFDIASDKQVLNAAYRLASNSSGSKNLQFDNIVLTYAYVAPQSYAVTLATNPASVGTITAKVDNVVIGEKVEEGKTVTLTAAPNDAHAYRFKEWQSSDVEIEDNAFEMPGKAVSITAVFEPLYAISVTTAGEGSGTATINGGTETIYVGEDDEITLVAEAAAGSEFGGWSTTDDILFDDETAANTTASAFGAGTITATFNKKQCTILGTPNVQVTDKTSSGAKLTWDAVANADYYEVYITKGAEEVESDLVEDAEYTISATLSANTEYSYSIIATSEDEDTYCDSNPAEGNFTTADYPAATLTLSENGGERTYGENLKVNSSVTLPNCEVTCDKVFVGWSTSDQSYTNLMAAGTSYTLTSTAITLYAWFATETPGSTTWNKVSSASEISDGTIIALAGTDGEHGYYAAKAWESPNTNVRTITATVEDNKLTSTEAFAALTLKANVIDSKTYYTIYDGANYWYANGATLSTAKNQLVGHSTLGTDGRDYWEISFSNGTASIKNKVDGRGTMQFNYNGGSPLFSCYSNASQKAVVIFKKTTAASSYSDYSLTCSAKANAPIFDLAEGTYTEAKELNISAEDGATIYYTLDGTEPDNTKTPYEGAIQLNTYGKVTVKAIAYVTEKDPSDVTSAEYMMDLPFTSLQQLAETEVTSGSTITISFPKTAIKSIAGTHGVYFDIQKEDKDIEIYCNSTTIPEGWEAGGNLSATNLRCAWVRYPATGTFQCWELTPSNWDAFTYSDPDPYTSVADLYAAGLVDGSKVYLNITDAYVHAKNYTSPNNFVYIQDGGVGIVLRTSEFADDNIGKLMTAKIVGNLAYSNGRPQIAVTSLTDVSYTAGDRPAAVATTLSESEEATQILSLVKIDGYYAQSQDKQAKTAVITGNADGSGASYTIYNLFGALKTIPESDKAINVKGLFYKKVESNVTSYSIVPVLVEDVALITPAAAPAATINKGSTDQANPSKVGNGEKVTITPAAGFTASYILNDAAEKTITATTEDITMTADATLILKSSRDYYTTTTNTYYYELDESLTYHSITKPLGNFTCELSNVSAKQGDHVTITFKMNEHWYLDGVTVKNAADKTVEFEATKESDNVYGFDMPAYDVTLSTATHSDPTYEITYLKNGKQTTPTTEITESKQFAGTVLTLKSCDWTASGVEYDGWKAYYVDEQNDNVEVELPITDNTITVPAHNVRIYAQWVNTYTVTFTKGSASSATGTVPTETPKRAGAKVTLPQNPFSLTGYTFVGWKANTDGEIYQPSEEYTMTESNVKFDAQWDVATYLKDGKWELVTKESDIVADAYYVMAENVAGNVASYEFSGNSGKQYMQKITVEEWTDKTILTKDQIPDKTAILKLTGTTGNWIFTCENNQKQMTIANTSDAGLSWTDAGTPLNIVKKVNGENNEMNIYVMHNEIEFHMLVNGSGGYKPYSSSAMAWPQLYRFYPKSWTVTFDDNVEDEEIAVPDMQRADPTTNKVTISDMIPVRTGYDFSIWNSAKGGTGVTSANPTDEITLSQNTTLYAQWNIKQYNVAVAEVENVTINAKPYGEADITEGTNADVNFKKSVVLTYSELNEDYVFKSWKVTKADDETTEVPVSVGSSTTFEVPAYAVTVSAVIESKETTQLTVTYHANGGVNKTPEGPEEVSEQVNWNTTIKFAEHPCPFEKNLCTFVGWNTKADGTGTTYKTQVTVKTDIDLYAMWEASGVQYKVETANSVKVQEGAIPEQSTATFENTYTNTATQLTADNSMTLTLSGYDGKVITGISLSTKSNSSKGSGTYQVEIGDKTIFTVTGSYKDIWGDWSTSFETQEMLISPTLVKDGENIVITISATENSLHCQSFTIFYTDPEIIRDELAVDQYTTFCWPKTIPANAHTGATFWNIENKTTMTDGRLSSITIVQHEGDLEAGVPYIMYNTATEFKCYQTGEAVDAPAAEDAHNGLVGVFEKTMFGSVADDADAAARGIYIISDGTLYLCGNNCGVYANRAYILNSAIEDKSATTPPAAPRRVIGNPNGTPTTLNGLFGNQAGKAQKALIDGHIYILRDNKMYNAQGLFVK